jgi:ABC-type multidrug transport system ATPase subunit/ABC-type multidrug transport system permease subunit
LEKIGEYLVFSHWSIQNFGISMHIQESLMSTESTLGHDLYHPHGEEEILDSHHEETPMVTSSPEPSHFTLIPFDVKEKTHKLPIQIEWRNVEVSVPIGKFWNRKHKKILNMKDQTCYVAPGEVLAIMGPSGCGKTTLLNVLAGRDKTFAGQILVNGEPRDKKFSSLSGFVQQDDILNANLTVRQSLIFTALLRLPNTFSISQKIQKVDELIDELGLTHCKAVKIGDSGLTKGISGGERKRVSIATEMITEPSVLFLDEPTSGLDSKTAMTIIELILELAKKGNRTIMMSIHQPRSTIFNLFDKLLLLASGKVAYFGPARASLPYFEKLGYPVPLHYNPADFFIDLVSYTNGTKNTTSELQRIEKIVTHFDHEKIIVPPLPPTASSLSHVKVTVYQTDWFTQFFVLLIRSFLNVIFDIRITVVRLLQTIGLSLIVGVIYYQTQNTQKGIQDKTGILFYLIMNQTMQSMMQPLMIFMQEKKVFNRERASRTFRVSAYYLAKTTAELPIQIIFPSIAVLISYWMAALNPDPGRFFTFWLIIVLTSWLGQAIGLTISAIVPNMDVAMAVTPLFQVWLMLFSGFYAYSDSIPIWLRWMNYLSFLRYAFQALVLNEFSGTTFRCETSELVMGICPTTRGEQVINRLSMQDANVWVNTGMIFAMWLIFRIWGYLALRYANRPKL